MVIPSFADELPVAVEIVVIAGSAKSAVHVGNPLGVGGKRFLELLFRWGMVDRRPWNRGSEMTRAARSSGKALSGSAVIKRTSSSFDGGNEFRMCCVAGVDPDETRVDGNCVIRQRLLVVWVRRGQCDKGEGTSVFFPCGARGESLQSAEIAGISPIVVPTCAHGGDGFAALGKEENHCSCQEDGRGEEARTLGKNGRFGSEGQGSRGWSRASRKLQPSQEVRSRGAGEKHESS